MAERKIITIKADRTRQIKFTYRALLELEKNGIEVFKIHQHRRFDDIMFMLQVGLMHEKEFSRDDMIDLMDTILEKQNIGKVFDLIVVAILDAMKSDDDRDNDELEESDTCEKSEGNA